MRKLHLVGLTTDRDGLIFTARKGSKSGGFIVPLDDSVLAAIAEARDVANGAPPAVAEAAPEVEPVARRLRSQSALTPREMQARLRAGRSIDEVAAEAGVDADWVSRFAVPILAEQAQVVELARGLVYAKPRLGESSQRLGESVVQNLSDRGVFLPDDVAKAGWSAFQLHDSVWMVRFRYRSRGRDQEAHWEIDVPAGRLHARNRQASDLGYVEPGRRSRVVDSEDDGAESESAPAPSRRSTAGVPKDGRKPQDKDKGRPAAARKRLTPTRPPAPVASRGRRPAAATARPAATKAAKATKTTKTTKAAKATKATKVTKASKAAKTGRKAGTTRAAPARSPAKANTAKRPAKAPTKTPAKAAPARRRSRKAAPVADGGPTAGSGGVRTTMAHVSTARVAASMASADRAPWAGAVPPRPGARPALATSGDRSGGRQRSARATAYDRERGEGSDDAESVGPFQPRPLPAGRDRSPPPARIRRVTVPRPSPASDGPEPVSLPAPRGQSPRHEAVPVERPKRRRLRST